MSTEGLDQVQNLLFSRERLAGYDPGRMETAHVLIVGCGALGQNLALPLALSGVGRLWLVDMDSFEDHNRSRSPLFPREEDRERTGTDLKAPNVAVRLSQVATAKNPRIGFFSGTIEDAGDALITGATAVGSCLDSPRGRAFLAERCRLAGVPLVEGGFDGLSINLSVFPNQAEDEACWCCGKGIIEEGFFSCRAYAARAEAQGVVPAVQPAAGALGNLMAQAVIDAIHGRFPLGGKRLIGNIRTGRFGEVQAAQDPECQGIHGTFGLGAESVGIGPGNQVGELLEALRGRIEEPSIRLPRPFIWSAPCRTCRKLVKVGRPSWGLSGAPKCRACSGEFELGDLFPLSLPEISDETEVDGLSCREVGLGPGSIFEVCGRGKSVWFRLEGDSREVLDFSFSGD